MQGSLNVAVVRDSAGRPRIRENSEMLDRETMKEWPDERGGRFRESSDVESEGGAVGEIEPLWLESEGYEGRRISVRKIFS